MDYLTVFEGKNFTGRNKSLNMNELATITGLPMGGISSIRTFLGPEDWIIFYDTPFDLSGNTRIIHSGPTLQVRGSQSIPDLSSVQKVTHAIFDEIQILNSWNQVIKSYEIKFNFGTTPPYSQPTNECTVMP